MSSRVLRKLQGEEAPGGGDDGKSGREDPEAPGEDTPPLSRGAKPKRPNLNPFELLNRESLSESEVKEDDDLGGGESSRSAVLRREDTRKKRKKKTRKKGAAGKAKDIKSSEDQDGEDEIDRSLREVNKMLGPPSRNSVAAPPPVDSLRAAIPLGSEEDTAAPVVVPANVNPVAELRDLLAVQGWNLNPENEMKRIFGSRVVQQAEMSRQHHYRHRGHHRGGHHGRARAPVKSSRSILAPKGNWPNPTKHGGGLSMKFVENDERGCQYFAFEHSKEYQKVQEQFFRAVQGMSPDFIVQILNEHPFHIDSMLQLSDICKMGEDIQMATELIERTLFAMEAAFHPLFSLTTGVCRLDYRRQENRAFFIALFRHLNFVGSRACYNTAWTFCKLLLSLDPDNDPVGILLLIDFYAIKAQQYTWFCKMYKVMEQYWSKNVSQLPNWEYSRAVALFYQSQEKDGSLSAQDLKELEEAADRDLQTALLKFPSVLLDLLDKCSVDAADAVTKHKFFLEASINQPSGLDLLCRLYVGRSFHIWKDPALLPWLERNARAALERVDRGDAWVAKYAQRRKIYQGIPRNIHRHIIMSDIQHASTSLPRELADSAVMSYDPLPPADSVNLYSAEVQQGRRAVDDPNSLALFFRSMLPNFDPNATVPEAEADAAGGAEGEGGTSLRRTVDNLYEAMQDLLSNLHLPEIPHEGADTEDSDDEQEDNAWE